MANDGISPFDARYLAQHGGEVNRPEFIRRLKTAQSGGLLEHLLDIMPVSLISPDLVEVTVDILFKTVQLDKLQRSLGGVIPILMEYSSYRRSW